MLRNLKVGTKLFAILVAPVVVILVLVTIGVRDRLAAVQRADRVEQVAEFAAATADLAQDLQAESLWSVTQTATDGTTAGDLAAQRQRTDAAVERYRAALDRVDPGREGGAVTEGLRLADARLSSLETARTSVDIAQVQPHAVADLYADTVGALVGVNASLVQTANDPELLRGLDTVASLERIKQFQGSYASQVVGPANLGAFTDRAGDVCLTFGTECDSYARAEQASLDLDQATRAFGQGSATPEERQLVQNAQASGSRFDELARQLLAQGTQGVPISVSAQDLTTTALERLESLAEVDTALTRSVVDTARELGDDASREVTFYLLGGLGALVVAFAVAVAVARSVTRPLERLTTAAYSLSTERLPALVEQMRTPDDDHAEATAEALRPIPVDSRDEIGQLAEAFNSIQAVTVDVAEEQSRLLRKGIGDIFVHLARRNQSLLDRQIEFIDHLESNEEDPDQLENLFKLDHLATRMRRNAESLLVLAGAEPPRRRGRPVPVADVVRLAIGEVEDYGRVHLLALDDATVAGNVAVDLAHMLSELMENSTHFSPPDTSVEVLGRRDDRNGYVLTVTDRGIGMNAEQLAEANAQLARPPLVGLSLSRSLGFIVIGRLAGRFGLTVTLSAGPNGGTAAAVTLPYSVVEYPEDHVDDHGAADGRATTARPQQPARPSVRTPRPGRGSARPVAEPLGERPSVPVARVVDVPAAADAGPPAPDLTPSGLPTRSPARATSEASASAQAPELPTRRDPVMADPDTGPASADAGLPRRNGRAPGPAEDRPLQSTDTLTAAGLVRRTPKPPSTTTADPLEAAAATPRVATRSARSPDEVRRMLSRYRSGLDRGRQSPDATAPDTSSDPSAPDTSPGPSDTHPDDRD